MNETITPSGQGIKPGQVTTISIMMLISGIINILGSLTMTGLIVLGTVGIGLLCTPVLLLPLVLGIFEIIYASKLMSNPPKPVRNLRTIAILEIVDIIFMNIVALATGIITLVFLNDPEVKNYLDNL
jgi:hypothetical protein